MSIKRIKVERGTTQRERISVIPYRLRLKILKFYPLYIKYSSPIGSLKKIEFCFSRDRKNLAYYNKNEVTNFTICEREEGEEESTFQERVVKMLTKHLFGYFGEDKFRKIFPFFFHMIYDGYQKDVREIFRWFPKRKYFGVLQICNPSLREDFSLEEDFVVPQVDKLCFRLDTKLGVDDNTMLKRLENWNKIIGRVNRCKSISLEPFFRERLEEEMEGKNFDFIGKLKLERFKNTLTSMKIEAPISPFYLVLDTFPNLKSFSMLFSDSNKEDHLSCHGKQYPNLRSLRVSGTLTNDNLGMIASLTPNLRDFACVQLATTKISRVDGWHSFFKNCSQSLEMIRFSYNRSLLDKPFYFPINFEKFINQKGTMRKLSLKNVEYTRWNSPPRFGGAMCINGRSRLEISDLVFFHRVCPNCERFRIDICSVEQAKYLVDNFKNLKSLYINSTHIGSFEDEKHVFLTLKSSRIEKLNTTIREVDTLSCILEMENLKDLEVHNYDSGRGIYDMDEYKTGGEKTIYYDLVRNLENQKMCKDVEMKEKIRHNNDLYIRRKKIIFEEIKSALERVKDKDDLRKLRRLSVWLGGLDEEGHVSSNDIRIVILEVIQYFKKNLAMEEDGNLSLLEFEIGSFENKMDEKDLRTIFCWKRFCGVFFEVDHSEFREDLEKCYEEEKNKPTSNEECTIL